MRKKRIRFTKALFETRRKVDKKEGKGGGWKVILQMMYLGTGVAIDWRIGGGGGGGEGEGEGSLLGILAEPLLAYSSFTYRIARVAGPSLFFTVPFRLLKSYGSGSGSDYWKVMVPVPIPVPTSEKLRFRLRFRLGIQIIKSSFQQKKIFVQNLAYLM